MDDKAFAEMQDRVNEMWTSYVELQKRLSTVEQQLARLSAGEPAPVPAEEVDTELGSATSVGGRAKHGAKSRT